MIIINNNVISVFLLNDVVCYLYIVNDCWCYSLYISKYIYGNNISEKNECDFEV